jgi:hypothetical protein
MTFVLKPQAPFERLKFANTCPEIALRKAIILQAIIDASNKSMGKAARKLATNAYKWLFGNSEGFRENCVDAELDPDFVVKIAKQMIELHRKTDASATPRFVKKTENEVNFDLFKYA